MKSKLAILLIPLSLLMAGLSARSTAQRAWNALVRYQTPYACANPAARSATPIVEHVYLVIVDGLRYDQSRRMSFLNELRAQGADIASTAGLPSLSLPGRAVMMTGAWQEVNGQLTNFNAHRLAIETLFEVAKKKNLSTALAAGKNPQKMFVPWVDEKIEFGSGGHESAKDVAKDEVDLHRVAAATRELIRTKHPNFFVMDYTMTDEVAHDFGGASEQYAHAAQVTDEEIRSLASIIDFSNSVLVVTADHGHVDRGGHGGDEPEVLQIPWIMAGKGIRSGTVLRGRQIDVAPTVAALLGTEIPASNQGRILLDALEGDDSVKQALLENLFQQKQNFSKRYLTVVRSSAEDRVPATQAPASATGTALETALDRLDEEAQTAKQTRMALEPAARLKWVLPLCFLPVVGFVVYAQRRWISTSDLAWGFLAVIIYWSVYFGLFTAAHMAYSFTAVNIEEYLGRFFGKDMIFAVVGLTVAIALTAGLLRRRSPDRREFTTLDFSRAARLMRFSYSAAALITFSILVKVGITYWLFGLFMRWRVPNMHWGFGTYLDLLQLMIIGFVAWLAPVAAWLGVALMPRGLGAVAPPA